MALQPVVDSAEVLAYLSSTELIDLRDKAVEELAVVGDDDRRAVESSDGFLQHVLRLHIEMVRRLIENQ